MRPYLILISTLLVFSTLLLFVGNDAKFVTKEGGVVETLSVVGYAVLLGCLLVKRPIQPLKDTLFSAVVVVFLMFRELDFDKAFTTMGIFKSRFYKSAEVPGIEKLVAVVVIVGLLYVLVSLVRSYGKDVLRGMRRGLPVQTGVVVALVLAAFSKLVLDGLPRKLGNIGLSKPDVIGTYHSTFEEVLELGIPIALLMSFMFHLKTQNSNCS